MSDEQPKRTLEGVQRLVDDALAELGTYFTRLSWGHYRAVQGTAEVLVDVDVDPDHEVMVRVSAAIAYGATLGEMDMLLLLQANANLPVATFAVDQDMTVRVGQTLMGDFLHAPELHRTVRAVALTANCLDEVIAERMGGKRSIDVKPWLKET